MKLRAGDIQSTAEYEREIAQWILGASQAGANDFWRVVSLLPGVYPTDVRKALGRLAREGMVPSNLASEVSTQEPKGRTTREVPGLPVASPLTADWRFTRDAAEQLLDRLTGLTGPAEEVALLGVPSVFRMAVLLGTPRQFVLVEQNESLVASPQVGKHTVHCLDLREAAPVMSKVRVVLADPPWYEDETEAFLYAAAQICAEQGLVLLGAPADGARPGVAGERERVVAAAAGMGLRLLGTESLALSYATPFFEYNALRAAGFKQISPNWRRGDIMIFERTNSADPDSPPRVCNCPEWIQVDMRGTAFWVRRPGPAGFADPGLTSLVPGDILPTVSRRDRRRDLADVWTAGNRIYGCSGGNILLTILQAIQMRQPPVEAVQKSLQRPLEEPESARVETAVRQIERILETELREIDAYHSGYAGHDTER